MKSANEANLIKATISLKTGKVIAYPTESCYGLGCDPDNLDAIEHIYNLKNRPPTLPFIIIISQWSHLDNFNCIISDDQQKQLEATWPGPVTWLIPIKHKHRLASDQQKIAVRMTDHPIARAICDHWDGAVVSTSANPHGFPSAKTALEVNHYFGDKIAYTYDGPIGNRKTPSDIFDLETKQQLR